MQLSGLIPEHCCGLVTPTPGCISEGPKEDLQRGRFKRGDPRLTPLGFHCLPGVEELCNALSNCFMLIIQLMAIVRRLVLTALVTTYVSTLTIPHVGRTQSPSCVRGLV